MRANEFSNEQKVLPSLWPDGPGYGLDRILKGADMPSVWPERGAYERGRSADLDRQAQGTGAQPGAASQPARWEIRWILAYLQHGMQRLLGHAGLRV